MNIRFICRKQIRWYSFPQIRIIIQEQFNLRPEVVKCEGTFCGLVFESNSE